MTTEPETTAQPIATMNAERLQIGETAIKALTKLGAEAAGVSLYPVPRPDGEAGIGLPETITVAVRHGAEPKIESIASLLEASRTKPRAKAGTAKALTLRAFIDLTKRHMTEHSVVFADSTWTAPSLTTVVDYHRLNAETAQDGAVEVGAAENLKHRIVYPFPLSEEWRAWVGQNGKPMDQAEFAAFLEDRIADLSSPMEFERAQYEPLFGTTLATPADLIQLARGLAVNVEAKVKNAQTLQSGETSIQFEEVHKDADGKPIRVPGLFMLQVAPFFMGALARIPVRLRYRVRAGTLVWFYQIWRPEFFVAERVQNDVILVAKDTGLPTFEGAPEA